MKRTHILLTILIILAFLTAYFYLTQSYSSPSSFQLSSIQSLFNPHSASTDSSPLPTATPTPLTSGLGIYNISQGKHAGPTINQVTFDPLDIQVGDQLTLTLHVLNSTPANTITATLTTDSSTEHLTFTKTSTNSDYETWTTDLKLTSPVLYQYILTVTSTSSAGSSSIVVAPRS